MSQAIHRYDYKSVTGGYNLELMATVLRSHDTHYRVYNKLSNVQRNIAINPMPVVTDKALLVLELYSVPVLLLLPSSCGTGEFL